MILFGLNIGGCGNANHIRMNCNQLNAKAATDRLIEKKGRNRLVDMTVTIEEDSIYFVVEYTPLDTMKLGGGGKFKVLKSNCKVVEQKFYQ